MVLGACSSDDGIGGDENGGQIAGKTEQRYLRVNLVNAEGGSSTGRVIGDTPNTDYANGTEAENKIRTVDFYLYDVDKNYHSHVPVSMTGPVDPTINNDPGKPSIHGFYETNIPVSLVAGNKLPQYVLCVINAVNSSVYENKPMSEAQAQILETFYSPEEDGKTYFGMNNSVYYGRDEVTGKDNQLIMATPFDAKKLHTAAELDNMNEADLAAAAIDIYVERYAAKVNFNIDLSGVQTYTATYKENGTGTDKNINLTFEPQKWGLNAYEKKFFALKSYRKAAGNGTAAGDYDDFATMDGILFAGWNRAGHFRSFWSRTPGYYADNYPLVADDILDVSIYPYNVYYQSYSSAANDLNSSQYAIESTLKGARLTGAGMPEQYLPLTSIPSVVLVGQYKIGGEAKTFYTYKGDNSTPYIYAATDGDISGVQTIKERLLSSQSVVLNASKQPIRTEVADGDFVVEHPKKAVRTGLKIGGDQVTLQLTSKTGDYYYYNSTTGQYSQITTDNDIATVNRLLYQNVGGAHAYINGKTFFSAPIQHWGWQRNDNANKDKNINEWNWAAMKTGDFGIVRNHVYTVSVTGISGLGTGIINDDDPLLPPTDKVSYAVRFRVNIQKWATLPVQKWEW